MKTKSQELVTLSTYIAGAAVAFASMPDTRELSEKLKEASEALDDAAMHICAQGYYGCRAGERCTSDHK